ncbi:hypothetical protein HY065_01785 [Candidatus Berkelbacteria bacterium]|nr:hypothetical protein [Candidatus Berkelbacteria bacterium]
MAKETEDSNKNAEPSFYEELDRRAGPRSLVSFGTLFIFLLILFVVGSVAAVLAVQKIKALSTQDRNIFPSQQAKDSIAQKIEALVKQSSQKQAQPLQITLTEEELTTLLSSELARVPFGKRFKEPQVKLDPPLLILEATLVDPLRSQTKWFITPEVHDGELVAKIVKVQAGKLTIPESIASQLTPNLNDLIASFVPLTGRFEVTAVEVTRSSLVISGIIK